MLFSNVDQATVRMAHSYRRAGKNIPLDELDLIIKKFPDGAVIQIAVIDAQGYLVYPRRPPKVLHLWPPKLLHPARGDLMH